MCPGIFGGDRNGGSEAGSGLATAGLASAYEYAEWKRCRVNLDYHVEIAKHF